VDPKRLQAHLRCREVSCASNMSALTPRLRRHQRGRAFPSQPPHPGMGTLAAISSQLSHTTESVHGFTHPSPDGISTHADLIVERFFLPIISFAVALPI
jgi:hypothetical protein